MKRRRRRRDPERTRDRILWLAQEAQELDDAREILHDALLEAHDVSIPEVLRPKEFGEAVWLGNLVAIKTLADEYGYHLRKAEHDAREDDQKRVIVFTPRWLAKLSRTSSRTLSPSPFTFMRQSYATDRLRGPDVVVYTTRAGSWGALKPYGT